MVQKTANPVHSPTQKWTIIQIGINDNGIKIKQMNNHSCKEEIVMMLISNRLHFHIIVLVY